MARIRAFTNAKICTRGKEISRDFYVDLDTGCIVSEPYEDPLSIIDMQNYIIAPAYQELQINGCLGVHFTTFEEPRSYLNHLETVSRHLVSKGVGGFYVTLPTVSQNLYHKVWPNNSSKTKKTTFLAKRRQILPHLKPQAFAGGADLLGAHCEGPWLNPLKKGAQDANLMQNPAESSVRSIYGDNEAVSSLKMVTLAPELGNSQELIPHLTQRGIVVSLGHTAADYDTGMRALRAGATMLTHVYNAMNNFSHRSPGVAGLVSSPQAPYFSLIADGVHLHQAALTMAFRANRERCILISDAIELAGLRDGVYPGHAQVPHPQRKSMNRVTIEGTDTLVGSCVNVEECVRNLKRWSGCSLAEAVRCASENIASLMNDRERGIIEEGRKADFVVLNDEGEVQQTWLKGEKLYETTRMSHSYALNHYQMQLMLLEQQNKKRLILAREEHEDRGNEGQ